MKEASVEAGATFINMASLGRDESNVARAERRNEHAGVAAHPGDKGMRPSPMPSGPRFSSALALRRRPGGTDWPSATPSWQIDLPGGRQRMSVSRRATLIKADGTGGRQWGRNWRTNGNRGLICPWPPDGAQAMICGAGKARNSPMGRGTQRRSASRRRAGGWIRILWTWPPAGRRTSRRWTSASVSITAACFSARMMRRSSGLPP